MTIILPKHFVDDMSITKKEAKNLELLLIGSKLN